MKRYIFLCIMITSCATNKTPQDVQEFRVEAPYTEIGWTEDEAVTFLIDKFTYGATPQLKEQILEQGINNWLTEQFNPTANRHLSSQLKKDFPVTGLSMQEIAEQFPGLIVTLRAVAINNRINGFEGLNGKVNFNEMFGTTLRHVQNIDKIWFYEMTNGNALEVPMKRLELGNFMELMYQMVAQKAYRATYSNNQLEEKLVDFWFNHFNVSITRINDVATNVLSYERDAIRPNIFGNFRDILKATAQHPAMLTYLDNTISNAAEEATTLSEASENAKHQSRRQKPGINENYARELLELHTLGVDGGYTQKDVEETARILTGWKTSPLLYPVPERLKKIVGNRLREDENSIVDNGFFFDATRHDAESKTVLGRFYPENQGVNEGVPLFNQLTKHPSTATHIAKKLVAYFVQDEPSQDLVETVANTFTSSNGDLKTTVKAMVEAPEFWNKKHQKMKAKSPFEFVVASLRKSDAAVNDWTETLRWVNKMGQPLYAFQPPTGYPTEQAFWINEAAIAQRIKFSYLLSQNSINGVSVQIDEVEGLASNLVSPEFQKR